MGNMDSLDSPWRGLRGSHHLPPYSILYVFPRHLHPNGFLSRDSQEGVPKLSQFALLGLWEVITPNSDLRLGWGLKQTCISPQELSKLYSTCTHWDQVDSQLLVVRSQTANLTPDLFFNHNLCFKCLNGSCKAILDIYTSKPLQRYKEHVNAKCFDPCNQALNFLKTWMTPSSQFWECEFHLHTCLKVGLWHAFNTPQHLTEFSRLSLCYIIEIVPTPFALHTFHMSQMIISRWHLLEHFPNVLNTCTFLRKCQSSYS